MSQNKKENKGSRRLWIVVLLISLLLLLGGAAAYIFTHPWWTEQLDPSDFHTLAPTAPTAPASSTLPPVSSEALPTAQPPETVSTEPAETTEPPLPDNPVDFAPLQEINGDIYAWIYIPMGPEKPDIDLPVLQAPQGWDENYYLHHDVNRNYLFAGCIYTQQANAKDFTDRVTVVYGHNMLDGTMFSNLPVFRDSRFFDEHEYFYIYTPGHILTYRIAAAIQFDTRHLLNCFDFSDDTVYTNWLQNYVMEPRTMVRNYRKDLDLTVDDRLVILSTCLEHGASRYLIEGVLISDEPTN